MKRTILLMASAFVLAVSCKEKKDKQPVEGNLQPIPADPAKDSADIREVITSFYNWYTANDRQLMKFDLYSGIKKKDEPPYKINWEEVDKYQRFIRDSIHQLGEEFLANQRKMFQESDSAFKKDTEDELPYNFDYDWYTNSQEDPQYTLDEVKKKNWLMAITGERAKVQIGAAPGGQDFGLVIFMKKENGRWTISKIGDF